MTPDVMTPDSCIFLCVCACVCVCVCSVVSDSLQPREDFAPLPELCESPKPWYQKGPLCLLGKPIRIWRSLPWSWVSHNLLTILFYSASDKFLAVRSRFSFNLA